VITDEKKLKTLQERFKAIIRYKTDEFFRNIVHHGGKEQRDIHWSSKNKYWSAYKIAKNKNTGVDNRYWNVFGLTDPTEDENRSLKITGEINIPLKNYMKIINGIFAYDKDTESVIVAHRGKFKNVNKEQFFSNYTGKCVSILDGDNNEVDVVYICEFPHDESQYFEFQNRVISFLIEVDRIKDYLKGNATSHDSERKQLYKNSSQPSKYEDHPTSTPSTSSNIEINKYLNQISSRLVKFMGKVLSGISNDWWNKTVINKLTDSQKAIARKKKITSLEELDIAALLRVFEQNCYEISQQCSFTYREGRHSTDGVILVRNRWAHPPSKGYIETVVQRDLDTLQYFLKLINDEV
jgi:hypothetical protein